jgi:hypothetical protein
VALTELVARVAEMEPGERRAQRHRELGHLTPID